MNNRIQELAQQAQQDYVGYQDKGLYYEIFAKLIVQECISAVEDTNDRHRRDYFAEKIKQHFGIQE
jgi:hypothetical protein